MQQVHLLCWVLHVAQSLIPWISKTKFMVAWQPLILLPCTFELCCLLITWSHALICTAWDAQYSLNEELVNYFFITLAQHVVSYVFLMNISQICIHSFSQVLVKQWKSTALKPGIWRYRELMTKLYRNALAHCFRARILSYSFPKPVFFRFYLRMCME